MRAVRGYGITPRTAFFSELDDAVKRNPGRFPPGLAFQLSPEERTNLKSALGIANSWGDRRSAPYVFTWGHFYILTLKYKSHIYFFSKIYLVEEWVMKRVICFLFSVFACFGILSSPTNISFAQTQEDCKEGIIDGPKTEDVTFLSYFYAEETGLHRAEFIFANGNTDYVTVDKVYKAVSKLKNGSKISLTYQVEQYWTEEGDSSCEQTITAQSIS